MTGRYPSEDVERLDQQFAEDDDERSERFRKARLKRKAEAEARSLADAARDPEGGMGGD